MDDAALRRQYDGLIERAGLRIPQDRNETMFNAYKQVAAWTEIVRTRRPAAAEPANAYALTTVDRLSEPGTGGAL
ncbi:MAG: hypothetical protein NXI18_06395 [Alphaproteobacteria bacterium]|nr:hypothetical protein [Alphaproteobacteria bacterium]